MNQRARLVSCVIFASAALLGCNQNQVPVKTAVAQNMEDTKRTIGENFGDTNQNWEQTGEKPAPIDQPKEQQDEQSSKDKKDKDEPAATAVPQPKPD